MNEPVVDPCRVLLYAIAGAGLGVLLAQLAIIFRALLLDVRDLVVRAVLFPFRPLLRRREARRLAAEEKEREAYRARRTVEEAALAEERERDNRTLAARWKRRIEAKKHGA